VDRAKQILREKLSRPATLVALLVCACSSDPSVPAELAQRSLAPDGAVAEGGPLCIQPLRIEAALASPAKRQVSLEVELRAVGEPLAGTKTHASGPVASGARAAIEVSGLEPGRGFHWAARAVDAEGKASAWLPFGANGEDAADFATCADAPTLAPATVTLEAPAGVSTAGWQVRAGLLTSAPAGAPLPVLDDQPQIVSALDAEGRLALLSLKPPGATRVDLSPLSTAQALAVLTGMVVGEYWEAPDAVQRALDASAPLAAAGALIAQKLPANPQALLDPEVLDAVAEGAEAALEELVKPQKASWPRPVNVNESGGVRLDKVGTVQDGVLSLTATNHKLRWLAAYVDKEDGTPVMGKTYLKAADMVQLYPPKAPGPSQTPLEFQLGGTDAKVLLKLYGSGIRNAEWSADPQADRAFAPTVFTVIDNFVVPAIGLFIRIKDAKKSPTVKVPAREKLVAAIRGDFLEKWKTHENLELALTMTRSMVYAVLNNENGVGEALLKDLVEGLAWDALLASAANYIPLVREIKLGVELSQRAMTIILTSRDLLTLNKLTTIDVRNLPPDFEALVTPTEGLAPLEVTARYEWDFEGDGTWDASNDTIDEIKHTYTQEGTYPSRMRIVDTDGAERIDEVRIKVLVPGLKVEDDVGFIALGPAGGPFALAAKTYFVSSTVNDSAATFEWKAVANESWVKIEPDRGVAAFSPTVVTVSIDAAATQDLPPGPYEADVSFQNLTDGKGNTTRRVALQILPPVTVTPEAGFTVSGPPGDLTGSKTYTVATEGAAQVDFTASAGFAAWLTVSPAQGTANSSGAEVTVSLNAQAATLPPGETFATVAFSYKNGPVFAQRTVKVTVEAETLAGVLDTTFGGGAVTAAGDIYAVEVDGSGRIVAAGAVGNDLALWRFLEDGSADTSYGTGGQVRASNPVGSYLYPYDMAIDSQGRAVVVSEADSAAGDTMLAVNRFTAGGAADTAFNDTGLYTKTQAGAEVVGYAVGVDGQDRVLVAGYVWTGSATREDLMVVRLTAAGQLDASFGGGMLVMNNVGGVTFSGPAEWANGIAADAQDRVLVAARVDGEQNDFATVLRFTGAGALDTAFGAGGRAMSLAGSSSMAEAFGLAVDAGGAPVVGGLGYYGSNEGVVWRYGADGAALTAFGGAGYARTGGGAHNTRICRVAVDAQGNVLAVGRSSGQPALWRFTPEGALDPSFGGGDGVVTADASQATYYSSADMAVDGSGRVLVAFGRLARFR
jgi:uncharacterized delta-60 repeat protein